MDVKYIIKIRWNCGTERYVTGTSGHNAEWQPEAQAMTTSDFGYADSLARGLNFNHLSGDLGGFACVVAIDATREQEYVNPSLEDEEDGENWRLIKLQETIRNRKEA